VQLDTTNILFICGGAFEGIEETIERRVNQKSLGFRAQIESKRDRQAHDTLAHVMPEDLLKYGLIPEFIGRLPVVTTLRALDHEALVQILTEPKNALVKQYKKFFEYDGVDLHFTDEALHAISEEAITRSTGARALRTIIEEVMRDIMYEIPSQRDIKKVIITGEVVRNRTSPIIMPSNTQLKVAS
jgi:ATP-dependent Clp protease ATP-binding subunit ClpX